MKAKLRLLCCFFALYATSNLRAQVITLNGPAGSGQFGRSVTVLANGNYVVTDPWWDNGAIFDAGAVYLYNGSTHALISTLTGSANADGVGNGGVTALSNGNFVVTSSGWRGSGGIDVGAVTWGNGTTGISGVVSSSNSLVGSTSGDAIGSYGIIALNNGNYIVNSRMWSGPGGLSYAGAITWGNGATGTSGVVGSSNSLVGTAANQYIGNGGIFALSNGNYVVSSPSWGTTLPQLGAATWGSGTSGVSGPISSSNSLVGSINYDYVGAIITPLTNGNYVVGSSSWNAPGPISQVGAATWANGTTGITGTINSSNSLVGGASGDGVGNYITALTNGNYVVSSSYRVGGTALGAITWANGTTGLTGTFSAGNSLVGTSATGPISGGTIIPLTNGNFVLSNSNWQGSTQPGADRGAVTWGNGTTGITGTISSSNSLIGGTVDDFVGTNVVALPNGNYVVNSPSWHGPGGTVENGAVTWGNGTTGTTGVVGSGNSLVGGLPGNVVGLGGVYVLTNGNYVVSSYLWEGVGGPLNAGAVTWGNGSTGTTGIVSSSNSLVGSTASDRVGSSFGSVRNGVTPLANGNYVVRSPDWDGVAADVGAITWGNGTTGIAGAVSSGNSLVGSTAGDNLGNGGITALTNGNYLLSNPYWDGTVVNAGALTWSNGTNGISGVISNSNSLVGSTNYDHLGIGGVTAVANGSYIVRNWHWNGVASASGAYTLGSGATPLTGGINGCNSILGGIANSTGSSSFTYNSTKEFLIAGLYLENKVKIFAPATQTLAAANTTATQTIGGTGKAPFIDPSCRLIATLQQTGPSPVSGAVTSKVYVAPTAPSHNNILFVRRHYDILPVSNAATSTATVTLYYSQADFDDYNSSNGSGADLPTGPADATGIGNLRVSHQHGTSPTGAPGTYSGATGTIDPADANIAWNSNNSSWAVTFDIAGFSGFFIMAEGGTPLPLDLTAFSANLVDDQDVLVSWHVTNPQDARQYVVERSADAVDFEPVTTVPAAAAKEYSRHDYRPLTGKSYYRLQIFETDGSNSYSKTESIFIGKRTFTQVSPSPAHEYFTLSTNSSGTAVLTDIVGRVHRRFAVSNGLKVPVASLPPGLYLLKLSSGEVVKIVKE